MSRMLSVAAIAVAVATLTAQAPVVQWQPQTSGVTVRLRGVSAVSSTVGWASGASGTVLRTTDGGTTWQRTGPVGAFAWGFDGCPHVGGALAVGADATTVHALVWTGHDTKRGAYALTSTDTGATWKAPVRVGPDDAWHVDLVRDGARLIATWDVNRPGDSHIGWASSADGGATWQEGGRLSGPGVRASHPKLVAAAGRVTAVWTERPAGGVLRWQQAAIPASTPSTIRR